MTNTETFRVHPAETITEGGHTVARRLCEELVEGRWEAFYSYNSDDLAGTEEAYQS